MSDVDLRNFIARGSLGTALIVAVLVSLPTALGQRKTDRESFVGTYSLVTIEEKDANGKWTEIPNFNSIGYITYSDTGHMGVHIMPKARARFLAGQPTPEEAQKALQSYMAYFGSFAVDEKEKLVVHHRVGQINPGGAVDAKRFYDFEVDRRGVERLILTPVPAAGGGKGQARMHLIWERLPNASLSAEALRFVGFYKLLYTDTLRMKDGKEVFHANKVYTRADTSYLIYTPTGHMMMHMMNNGYSGYFGRFVTRENRRPALVIHKQQGATQPAGYSDQEHSYELNGNVLTLGGPPMLNDAGETVFDHQHWERLGPAQP